MRIPRKRPQLSMVRDVIAVKGAAYRIAACQDGREAFIPPAKIGLIEGTAVFYFLQLPRIRIGKPFLAGRLVQDRNDFRAELGDDDKPHLI